MHLAQPLRARKARNFDVLRLALESIQMHDDRPEAKFNHACAGALLIGRAEAAFHSPLDWPRKLFAGNAIVDHVHGATDGVGPVKKGGGAAHDFDALDGQRLDRDGVIRADVRGIDGGETILKHANPILSQAANDRTARARPEISGADARLAIKRLTDRRLEPKLQFVAAQDGDRLGLLRQFAPKWSAPDHDGISMRRCG